MRVPARRCLLQRRGDHRLDLLVPDQPGPARPRLVGQPLQPGPLGLAGVVGEQGYLDAVVEFELLEEV